MANELENRIKNAEYVRELISTLSSLQIEQLEMAMSQGPKNVEALLENDPNINPDALTTEEFGRRLDDWNAEKNAYQTVSENEQEETSDTHKQKRKGHFRDTLHVPTPESLEQEAEEHAKKKADEWEQIHPNPQKIEPSLDAFKNPQEDILSAEGALRKGETELEELHHQRIPNLDKIRAKEKELTQLEQKHKTLLLEKASFMRASSLAKPTISPKEQVHNTEKQKFYDDFVHDNLAGTKGWITKLEKEGKKPSPHLIEAIRKEEESRQINRHKNPGIRKRALKTVGAGILTATMLGNPQPTQQVQQNTFSPQSRPNTSLITRLPSTISNIRIHLPQTPRVSSTVAQAPRQIGSAIGSSVGNLGKKIVGSAANLVTKTIARIAGAAIISTLGTILSLPILAVLAVIVVGAAVVGFFFFWLPHNSSGPLSLPNGLSYTYIVEGPTRVDNGNNIQYELSLACDSTPGKCESLTLIDTPPPSTAVSIISATGIKSIDNTTEPTQISWKISDNTPLSLDPNIVGDKVKIYSFTLVLHPIQNDITITNNISVKGQ